VEFVHAIEDYVDKHNHNPKPFAWAAKADDFLERVKRARDGLDNR